MVLRAPWAAAGGWGGSGVPGRCGKERCHPFREEAGDITPMTVLPSPLGVLLLPVYDSSKNPEHNGSLKMMWVVSILEIPVSFPPLGQNTRDEQLLRSKG